MQAVEVRDEPDHQRYVLEVDGTHAGVLDYQLKGDRIRFTHAEIDPALERQGLGSQLAKFALDEAREHGLTVVPMCPFVVHYIRDHPEYLDLVPRARN
jgi:predicted GNAT family acetyltransferase